MKEDHDIDQIIPHCLVMDITNPLSSFRTCLQKETHIDRIFINFQKYDFGSIMHYDSKVFGKNGATVMKKRENTQNSIDGKMGNRIKMSDTDKKKLKNAYKCFGEENFLVLTNFLVMLFGYCEFVLI